MRGEVIAALEKRGWGIDEFVEKGMIPLLQAKKTIFAQHEGIFTDKREVDANSTRLGANDQYLKLLGVCAPVSIEHSGAVVHVLTEAEKREAAETVKRLMAYDSEAENPIKQGRTDS